MAYGGGTFSKQNMTLPGSYMNFVSAARASSTIGGRGIATMPLELDWGEDRGVFEVSENDFRRYSQELFGYAYTDEKMKGLRDLFLGASTLYAYRLNSGEKAANKFCTAKHSGTRGNDFMIAVQLNVNDAAKFDVSTYLGTELLDEQTVSNVTDLSDNDYVVWKQDAELTVTAATPLTGGTNGVVTGGSHQAYIDAIESYGFNTMGVVTSDDTVKNLYAAFAKRMREEVGVKFQVVLYQCEADYEGVIDLNNKVTDEGWPESSLVYWATGKQAGCAVQESCTNKVYNGSFAVDLAYTQLQLNNAIKAGKFMMHAVNGKAYVLTDINSLVSVTEDKGEDFKQNQTVRVLDQIGNDIALLFNSKYLGNIPNDAAGRISLWSDIVKHHQEMQTARAIEGFSSDAVTVELGDTKKFVVVTDSVKPVNCMEQLYMTIYVN